MGEHRASVKIEMEFHGVKDKCDMWINYSDVSSDAEGVDQRVIEFCRNVYERGMAKYDKMIQKRWEEENKERIEAEEKATLKKLKDKYEFLQNNSCNLK